MIHRGHYAGRSDSWDRLMGQWLPGSGYRVDDRVAYEVYRVADHARPDTAAAWKVFPFPTMTARAPVRAFHQRYGT